MRPASSSITLRDVARDSGVSITTVSRILNGRESGVPIRDETRDRVLAVAAELGYKPNLLARGLRGSRSSLIGVIARDISDPFHIQVLRGINAGTRSRDYRLFLGHVDYRPDVAIAYGSMFERSHADGIIVIGDMEGDESLGSLAEQHRHVIGVSDRVGPRRFPGVYCDSVRGTQLALEHLLDAGHRRIACVSDPGTHDQRLRAELYERFMVEHGLAEHVRRLQASQPDPAPSYRLGLELFGGYGGSDDPTAIFATSDMIAIGLLEAAFEVGIPVPDRVSIVGFDNLDIAAFTIPPLTTIDQSGVEMGRVAAEMLLDMVEHDEADQPPPDRADVVLEPALVIRRTTSRPPA